MKLKRRYQILIGVLVVLAIVVVVATVYFEGIVKGVVLSRLDDMGFEASISDLNLGIFRGVCSLEGLQLARKGGEQLLDVEYASVNINLFDAVRGNTDIDKASLEGGTLMARVGDDGKLNWLTLLPASDSPGGATQVASSEPAPFSLGGLRIEDLEISIEDERADTRIESAKLNIGQLGVNLSSGTIKGENIELSSQSPEPPIKIESMTVKGNLTYPFEPPLKLTAVDVSGLKGGVRLNEQGKSPWQTWLMGIAEENGLIEEKQEQPQPGEEAPLEIPSEVRLANVDVELIYPGQPASSEWKESLQLAELNLVNSETLDVSDLKWSGNREVLGDHPVIELSSCQANGTLLETPRNIKKLQVKGLKAVLVKPQGDSFDAMQRAQRLRSLVLGGGEEPAETSEDEEGSMIPKMGQIDLSDVRIRLLALLPNNEQEDNVIALDSLSADFSDGRLNISEILVSNEQGSLEDPSVSVPRISGSGELTGAVNGTIAFKQISIERPRLSIKKTPQGISLKNRVDRLRGASPDAQKTESAEEKEVPFRFSAGKIEVTEADVSVEHILESGKSISYNFNPTKLVLTDVAYPGGGEGWTEMQLSAAVTQPAGGNLNVDGRLQQKDIPSNFNAKMDFNVDSITAFRPYYEGKLPISFESGNFAMKADGSCKERNLDFPFEFEITSPEVVPAKAAGLNPLQGLSNAGMQTIVASLKDSEGNISYSGSIRGSLDDPRLIDPWKEMGLFLARNIQKTITNVPGLLGEVGETSEGAAKILGDTAESLGEGAKGLGNVFQGLIPGGSKKENEKEEATAPEQ